MQNLGRPSNPKELAQAICAPFFLTAHGLGPTCIVVTSSYSLTRMVTVTVIYFSLVGSMMCLK